MIVSLFIAWVCISPFGYGLKYLAASRLGRLIRVELSDATSEKQLIVDGQDPLVVFSKLLFACSPLLRPPVSSHGLGNRGQRLPMGSSEVAGLDEFLSQPAGLPSDGGALPEQGFDKIGIERGSDSIDLQNIEELLSELDVVDDAGEDLDNFASEKDSNHSFRFFSDDEELGPGKPQYSGTDTISETLKLLEWDRFSKMVASQAETKLGKQIIEAGLPVHLSREESEALQVEMEEAFTLEQVAAQAIDLRQFFDFRAGVTYASKGGTLDGSDFATLATSLESAQRLITLLRQFDGNGLNLLPSYFEGVSTQQLLCREISNAIDEGGRVLDRADAMLGDARAKLRNLEGEANTQIRNVARAKSKFLANTQPTRRNGRYVLLVLAKQKHHIRGSVLDASSSGGSLYVEPKEVAQLNTQISQLQKIERKLERKVLQRLSGIVGDPETTKNLLALVDKVAKVDCALARARYSAKLNAQPLLFRDAKMSDQGLRLLQLRHPLIVWPSLEVKPDNRQMVPMDIFISPGVRSVVITGPNTGGKTVILKTLGMAALMAKAGLRVLCELEDVSLGKVSMPFFDAVMADIGDDQSIVQSLSTFSSHVTRIRRILAQAAALESGASLVLLDEVGSGTDPTEGSALGMAVLRQLTQDAALSLATTHHSRLKTLKYSDVGHLFENACVEFDVSSMAPTYQVLWGVPGQSNALAIAERLGLQKNVVKDARALLNEDGEESITLEQAISDLQSERKMQLQLNAELKKWKEAAEQETVTLAKQTSDNIKYEMEIRKKALAKVEAEAKIMQDSMRKSIDARQRMDSPKVPEVTQAKTKLNELRAKLGNISDTVPLKKFRRDIGKFKPDPKKTQNVAVGDRIAVASGEVAAIFGSVATAQFSGKFYTVQQVRNRGKKIVVDGGSYLDRSAVTCIVRKGVELRKVKGNTLDLQLLDDTEVLAKSISEACALNKMRGTLWIRVRTQAIQSSVSQVLEQEDLVDWYEEIREIVGSNVKRDELVWIRAHLKS